MNEIEKSLGIWVALAHEPNTKTCAINLAKRLPYLSSKGSFKECQKEWSHIIGHTNNGNYHLSKEEKVSLDCMSHSPLCLCGMEIFECYYVMNDVTKNIAQIGKTCIERINPTALVAYKESLKKKGICYCCETSGKLDYFRDLEKHYKSKVHQRNELKFRTNRDSLLRFVDRHIRKYKEVIKVWIELEKISRKCITCDNRILNDEPDWKVRCIDCYKSWIKS